MYQDQRYTYKEYQMWPIDESWELIHGVPYNMSPAPSRLHQKVLRELFRRIADFLDNKPCEVYCAPFDVRFPEHGTSDEEIDTVVQPDISVIWYLLMIQAYLSFTVFKLDTRASLYFW